MKEKQQISCLEWVKENCIFPPGSNLVGKVCGPYLLPFQIKILQEVSAGKSLFLYGARKVSKSLLFSWILYYRLATDKVAFVCPLLASSEEQTGIIYKMIRYQVIPKKDDFVIRQGYIENKKTGSTIIRAPSRAGALFGYQPSGVVADELSNWKDEEPLEAVESGFGLSGSPLRLYASNPPTDPTNFVLDKLKEAEKDDDFYVKRFEAGPKDNWMEKSSWKVANPFVKSHYSKKGPRFHSLIEFYEKRCAKAKQSKTAEVNFRRYQIGQTVFADLNKWLDVTKIKTISEDIFKKTNIKWALGADISASRDFTAFCIAGMDEQENIYFKPFLYLPTLENRRVTHRYKFNKWAKAGFMSIQNSEVTDRGAISKEIKEYIGKHNIKIQRFIIDKWRAENWYAAFSNYKIEKITTGPSFMTMPIKELERVCHNKKLHIIGEKNPCMDWQINNCVVSQESKSWSSLRRKDRKEDNIDGAIALCLACYWPFSQGTKKFTSFFIPY